MKTSGNENMSMKQLSKVLASRGVNHKFICASHTNALHGFVESLVEDDWKPLTAFLEEFEITDDKLNIVVNIKGEHTFIIDIFYDISVGNKTLVACSGRGTTKCDGHYVDNVGWDLKHLNKNKSELKRVLSSFLLEAFSKVRDLYLNKRM